jgi:hypothetical protein
VNRYDIITDTYPSENDKPFSADSAEKKPESGEASSYAAIFEDGSRYYIRPENIYWNSLQEWTQVELTIPEGIEGTIIGLQTLAPDHVRVMAPFIKTKDSRLTIRIV